MIWIILYAVSIGGMFYYMRQIDYRIAVQKNYISVVDYGAVGDGSDDTAAFKSAFYAAKSFHLPIVIPQRTYSVRHLDIQTGMVIRGDGATIKHIGDGPLFSAIKADGWEIEGITLIGNDQADTGLYISGCARYTVSKMKITGFSDYGINIVPGKANRIKNGRGAHGNMSLVSLYENNTGLNIEAGTDAEYNLFTMMSITGNKLATSIVSGNNIITTSNITDNDNGVQLMPGANNGHGIFSAVNINHNRGFNIKADDVSNGYTFNGCHVYGDGEAGAIVLNNSPDVTFPGCVIKAPILGNPGP